MAASLINVVEKRRILYKKKVEKKVIITNTVFYGYCHDRDTTHMQNTTTARDQVDGSTACKVQAHNKKLLFDTE